MRIGIIGAGVVGLCSAYWLGRSGHDITVIEKRAGPGEETSLGNGGTLAYSAPTVWNEPGAFKMFLLSFLRPSRAPIRFGLQSLPGLLPWGARFLRYANKEDFLRLTSANQRLASHSRLCLEKILEETGIACGYENKGFLEIFDNESELVKHSQALKSIVADPATVNVMTPDETVRYEPSLSAVKSKLAGAILLSEDKSADCHVFCVKLAAHLKRSGVSFLFDAPVRRISKSDGLFACSAGHENLEFDRLVIAAGNGSRHLASQMGVKLAMQPAKGFSFTVPMERLPVKPLGPIVDITTKSGVNPLEGKRLRYVGGAELSGMNRRTPQSYWRKAYSFFDRLLPEIEIRSILENERPWIGFRPMSVDGVPMIGPTNVPGLYVNTAHGWLGWTLAAGSAKLLAGQINGRVSGEDMLRTGDYLISRFRGH